MHGYLCDGLVIAFIQIKAAGKKDGQTALSFAHYRVTGRKTLPTLPGLAYQTNAIGLMSKTVWYRRLYAKLPYSSLILNKFPSYAHHLALTHEQSLYPNNQYNLVPNF